MIKNERNKLLGKIHIAKKELGLDDDTYRGIIKQATNKESSAKCTDKQLIKVIELFKAKGWTPKGEEIKPAKKPVLRPAIKKIYALWGNLQRSGKVKSREASALDNFIAKYTSKKRVKELTDAEAQQVIEILKKIVERD